MYSRCQAFTKTEFQKNDLRLFWPVLIIFFSIIWSCQQKTQKVGDTTNTEVYIRYLADTKELKGEATFFSETDTGNTILNFDNVTFANHLMKGKKLSANHTRYRIDLDNHTLAPKYDSSMASW